MYHKIKHIIGNNLINVAGWKTKRRIVVFESDDWGAIRMPDIQARNSLLSKFPYSFSAATYDKVDNLANSTDLAELFDVLQNFKDINGRHPKFTLNTIVANPDFNKIKNTDFQQYYYTPFIKTLDSYRNHEGTFDVWKEGISRGLIKPQLHGREHLNVTLWMKCLKDNITEVHESYKYNTWNSKLGNGKRLDVAFNYEDKNDLLFISESITEAADLFCSIFGYRSESFIAPAYTWDSKIEDFLHDSGVKYIQGGVFQLLPEYERQLMNKKTLLHYMGQKNRNGQIYLIRNAHFEPVLDTHYDVVDLTMNYLERIFRWNKPAIISTHRLNYIGNLEPQNRVDTLGKLKTLLTLMLIKYPDIEFFSSDELGKIIQNSQ